MCKSIVGDSAAPVRLVLLGRQVACKAVIFDKDGTLVDPTGLQARLTRMRALRHAAGANVGNLRGAAMDLSRSERGDGDGDGDGDGAASSERDIDRLADDWIPGPALLPGAHDVLCAFGHLGLRLAIATGDRRRRAEAALDALGIGDHFAAVIGNDDVAHGKPAPDMVHVACERLGCLPEEVIVVGDSPADLMMGRAAGVAACIAVSGGVANPERLGTLADAVLTTVAELPGLLAAAD